MPTLIKLRINRGEEPTPVDDTDVSMADVLGCRYNIMFEEHYRSDGTCLCDNPYHTEMIDWGFQWDGTAKIWVPAGTPSGAV